MEGLAQWPCAGALFLRVQGSAERNRLMERRVRVGGVMSGVGYSLRYFKGTTMARRMLEGREIAMVAGNRWGGIPGVPWWRVMDKSGGQLVEMATHQVDLMRALAGEIVEVSAR